MKRVLKIVGVILAANAFLAVVGIIIQRLVPSYGDEDADEISLTAAMRGIDLRSRARAFRGGSIRSIMGGTRLDLRQAMLHQDGAVLDLTAIMAGIQVVVPSGWRVTSVQSRVILGGVDAPHDQPLAPEIRSRLTIRSLAILGGIQVTAKPEDILIASGPIDPADLSRRPSES